MYEILLEQGQACSDRVIANTSNYKEFLTYKHVLGVSHLQCLAETYKKASLRVWNNQKFSLAGNTKSVNI